MPFRSAWNAGVTMMMTWLRSRTPASLALGSVLRLVPATLVAAMLSTVLAAPIAAQAPSEPEARAFALINQARANLGRVPLRWDGRLADVAQEHSNEMAATGLFAHSSNLGKKFADRNITWSYLAEVILKGTPRTPVESAEEAVVTWRNSKAHWDLLSNVEFNYVGFAVARASDGWYYWTGVLIRGPDRTSPTASMTGASLTPAAGGSQRLTLSWRGADVPLSVLTAGLRDFKLQRRVNSGSWRTVGDWTTATSRTLDVTRGKTYRFRVRARDWNGNRSTWTPALTVRP